MTREDEIRVVGTALDLMRQLESVRSGIVSATLGSLLSATAMAYNASPDKPIAPKRRTVTLMPYENIRPEVRINPAITAGMLAMPIAILLFVSTVSVISGNPISKALVVVFLLLELISVFLWYNLFYVPAKKKDFYLRRLDSSLHDKIVELEPQAKS